MVTAKRVDFGSNLESNLPQCVIVRMGRGRGRGEREGKRQRAILSIYIYI